MSYLLIGRANAGKSSIFNIITSHNRSIVHSEAGTTRDWHKELILNSNLFIYDTPGEIINESLKNCDFSGMDLSGMDLSGMDLSFSNFENSNLTNTNFANTIVANSNFRNSIMENINFKNSNLESK